MSSIFKRNKIWWVIYYRDGKKVTYSLQTTDRQEAKLRQVKIDYKLATGQAEMPSKTEIVPLLEEYCSHVRLRKCPKPYKTDVSILRYFFGPICQAIKPSDIAAHHANNSRKPPFASLNYLEDITPAQINQYLSERKAEGLAPKTVNHYRQVLHSLFNYAVRYHNFRSRDARYPNPVGCIDRFPETVPEIRFLELEDIDKQLEVLGGHKVLQAAVATLIYTGLRRSEALWLTKSDLDLKNRLIRVRAKRDGLNHWQTKTRRNRAVPISNALYSRLSEYKPPTRSKWYFPSPEGCRWNEDNFSSTLRSINKAAGLDWSCLEFRHTFGSHLAMKGESLYKISKLMGNSPEICRRHYAALIPERMHDTVEFHV